MNILRRYASLINVINRILDIAILLIITWLVKKWFGQPELMRVLAIYGSMLMAAIFSLFNVYKSWRSFSLLNQIKTLFFAWVSALLIFNILILLLSTKEQLAVLWPFCLFRNKEFILWSLFVFFGITAIRVAARFLLVFFRKRGYNQRSAVIVGAGQAGRKLSQFLHTKSWMGIKVVGFFDDRLSKGEEIKASPNVLGTVLGPVDECPEFSMSKGIDIVFIALPMRAEEKINKIIWDLGTKGVDVFLVPDLFILGIQKSKIRQIGELYLLDFNLFPAWKRAFDILFSLVIIILTIPVWLTIIALIKLEDNGPIFYKHWRVMDSGKGFSCLKFRTMHVDADQRLKDLLEKDPALREEWERTYKLKNDPRTTRAGSFLRKTSLDELPQFVNVLSGQMSVVGARPVVPEELEKYYKDTTLTYCATKPGITGPWQAGKRSDTENYDERVELDRWYILNCSLWLDIKIIFKTIWSIVRGNGAY
ncbi:MAG: sugar transferase [Deltaproteobacteria bacterium]|nr:sugar transferase [Deltaproteobacteria bacterium]